MSATVTFAAVEARADLVEIEASADTTLHEFYPENNFGAYPHVSIGAIATLKPDSASPYVTRGLFQFDLAARIPARAKVTDARLLLTITFKPAGEPIIGYELHRMLRAWGEGNKRNSAARSGETATLNEASWSMCLTDVSPWMQPGGAPNVDYAEPPSVTILPTKGAVRYTFGSNAAIIADVQDWMEHPANNFGWLVKGAVEDAPQSACRFGSREDSNRRLNVPLLFVEFETPSLRIASMVRNGPNVVLTWAGGKPPYRVQRKTSLSEVAWLDLGEVLEQNKASVPIESDHAFFRITEAH